MHECAVPHTKRLAVAQFQEIDRRARLPAWRSSSVEPESTAFRYTVRVIASHTRTHAHSWALIRCVFRRWIYIDISHIVHVVRTFPCHLFRAAVLSYSPIQQMHFLFSSPLVSASWVAESYSVTSFPLKMNRNNKCSIVSLHSVTHGDLLNFSYAVVRTVLSMADDDTNENSANLPSHVRRREAREKDTQSSFPGQSNTHFVHPLVANIFFSSSFHSHTLFRRRWCRFVWNNMELMSLMQCSSSNAAASMTSYTC